MSKKSLSMALPAILLALVVFGGTAGAAGYVPGGTENTKNGATTWNQAVATRQVTTKPATAKMAAGVMAKVGLGSILLEKSFPEAPLAYADAVTLLVEKLDLNMDRMRFVQEPQASDYFDNIKNDAPYAKHFIIAYHNGLPLPRELDPEASITKEEFAHLLFHAMSAKGDFAFIEIFILISDEQQISEEYMDSIQKLLIANIASLDEAGNFHPKANMGYRLARHWIHNAVEFVKQHPPFPEKDDSEVTMEIEKINDEVNKITVKWGEKPNPGYGISITGIEFSETEKTAYIYYQLHYPDPNRMYPQVIVYPQAATFVSSEYKPVLRP